MEQHESDLIRDLIKANREEVVSRVDAQGKRIEEIEKHIEILAAEYDVVRQQQLEIMAKQKAYAEIAENRAKAAKRWVFYATSFLTCLLTSFEILHAIGLIR